MHLSVEKIVLSVPLSFSINQAIKEAKEVSKAVYSSPVEFTFNDRVYNISSTGAVSFHNKNDELKALALFAIAYDLEREMTRINPKAKGYIAFLCRKEGFGKGNEKLIRKYAAIYEETKKELLDLFEKDMPAEVVEKFRKVPEL